MADDTNTAEREAFEKWVVTEFPSIDLTREDDGYYKSLADEWWTAFKAGRASLAASAGSEPVAWTGGEEWEQLAWHLCAEENGEESCDELIWEGGPIPEPWGPRWMKYEHEATRMIELVRKFTHPSPPEGMAGWRPIESFSEDEADELIAWKPGLGRVIVTWLPDGHPDADEGEGWHEAWSHKRVRGITHARIPPAPPLPASEAKEL